MLNALKRPDLWVFLVGLVLFSAGLALAWPPLGLIGPGLVLMAAVWFDDRKAT